MDKVANLKRKAKVMAAKATRSRKDILKSSLNKEKVSINKNKPLSEKYLISAKAMGDKLKSKTNAQKQVGALTAGAIGSAGSGVAAKDYIDGNKRRKSAKKGWETRRMTKSADISDEAKARISNAARSVAHNPVSPRKATKEFINRKVYLGLKNAKASNES